MNPDLINEKIKALRSLTGIKSARPDVPVHFVVQEAFNLYEFCKEDREKLINARLDWSFVEDLPIRATVLSELQSAWNTEYTTPDKSRELWKEELSQARELRKDLLHIYYFVLETVPDVHSKIRQMTKGRGNPDFIQSLCSLAELGNVHRELLESNGIDFSLIDKVREMGTRLSQIYATAKAAIKEGREGPELRNKAFYHLREAVKEIRRVGKFVFRKDKERYKGYLSDYMTKKGKKRKRRKKKAGSAAVGRKVKTKDNLY
jgi:hypothetical protein